MDGKKEKIKRLDAERALIHSSFPMFALALRGKEFLTPFHLVYYKILDAFAQGIIKKLIVSVPPQHGKSEGSTRLLPAYLHGINPDLRIAIASYSDSFARKFNRAIQRIIDEETYYTIFPGTILNGSENSDSATSWVRTSTEFEIVGRKGSLKAIGRDGQLTGDPVDIMIMDDLYKNAREGNSPLIRDAVWEWYGSVVETRVTNDTRQLIVFTRWHEDDLIGMLLKSEDHIELTSFDQLDDIDPDTWVVVNFEAIMESAPTELDPRELGAALWPAKHSIELLEKKRRRDPVTFNCMYQGKPLTADVLLYGDRFQTYGEHERPTSDQIIRKANYTDTADTGEDFLCSICYDVGKDKKIYVTDVLFTGEPMEVTEPATAAMLTRNNTREAMIESNNGGRSFARALGRMCRTRITWFHQSGNKEARILTNAPTVLDNVIFPSDWKIRWPEFYINVTTYRRSFRANRWHDAADTLTGIMEKELDVAKNRILAYG